MESSILDINNITFNNNKINIVLDEKNNPWFKAKDVATILEYNDTDKAIRKNVDDDDKKTLNNLRPACQAGLSYNEKNTIYINESGLYSLILSSKKSEAKKFKKWVTSEVLPSIRKYGEYKLKEEIENITNQFQEQLTIKDEQLNTKDSQLKIQEQTIKDQIKINQEKEIKLQQETKLKEDYKEYCNRIQSLEKQDIIYILTNDVDIKNNIFKLGKTKLNYLKKRLSTYNTGASNPYYYVYYKEVFNGEQIEKKFNELMNRYNIKINNKTNKEIYQLYLPDFEFYLEKVIDSNDYLFDLLNKNHETIFLNSKNKQSTAVPIIIEEEFIKNIKINDKIVKSEYFEDLNKDEQLKIIKDSIDRLENNIKRTELENNIKSEYNLVINRKMPFWNLIKEANKSNKNVKVTYF